MDGTDLVIIGAGPAGLTAGIYSSRSGISTSIYERGLPGGLATVTHRIDNYPGFPESISGIRLGQLMHEQAKRFGARIVNSQVDRLWKDGRRVLISIEDREISALTAIVATGSTPRRLDVPGEARLTGQGVSYCATCDGPLYKDQVTAIIGGGNSALQEAIFLARFASKVILIHRRDEFRGVAALQEEVRSNPKIELALNKIIKGIEGTSAAEGVRVVDKETGREEVIAADGVFIYVGYSPNVQILGHEFKRGQTGFLLTGPDLETSVEGVFAAGDVREKQLRQVATAVGDGAAAAMSVYTYLEHLKKQP